MKLCSTKLNIFAITHEYPQSHQYKEVAKQCFSLSIKQAIEKMKEQIKHVTRERDQFRYYIYSPGYATLEIRHISAIVTKTVFYISQITSVYPL